jgi:hypothetical protein
LKNDVTVLARNPLKTRKDVQDAVLTLCNPVKPYFSLGCARLKIGETGRYYCENVAMFEAFSRILWGLVPLTAGGMDTDFWEIYLQGIIHGTDPEHEEYWGILTDCDQRMVEMAVIGLALCLIPEKVWIPLTDLEKQNFAKWMNQINEHDIVQNNWLFFRVFVNCGLQKVGAAYDSAALEDALNRVDSYYLDNGWYSDGFTEQMDYYIAFGMHFYSLVYAKLLEDRDPIRSESYKKRAAQFAKDFIYWFAEDGSAIPYGRSMTYRFAQSAFWSALAYAGVEVYPWGVVKGLVLRNLRWWFKQPILTKEGLLTVGYSYPNLVMSEGYNGEGGAYWAMKTFLPLALDENHPFWQAKEESLPKLDKVSVQMHPHMHIVRDEPRHVMAFTSGQYAPFEPANMASKYEKFVYSNVFGFSVMKGNYGLEQGAFDSMLALSEGDNYYRGRHKCEEYRIENRLIYSKWLPFKDGTVTTWLIPGAPWHIRLHHIVTKRSLDTAEGGFAISREMELVTGKNSDIIYENGGVAAKFPWATSGIIDFTGKRTGQMVIAEPNTNLLHPRTAIPTLIGHLEPGTHWLACAVYGKENERTNNSGWNEPPAITFVKDEGWYINLQGEKEPLFIACNQ